MKKKRVGRIVSGILTLLVFISVDGWTTRISEYENYASADYKGWPRKGVDIYDWYDLLGEKIITGYNIYDFYDKDSQNTLVTGESRVYKSFRYNRWVSELIVVSDEFEGTKQRIMLGDELRTKFSSYLLDKTGVSGIRWDMKSKINESTMLYSRISGPITVSNASYWDPDPANELTQTTPIYLLGLYNDLNLWDQKLGAAYVNAHIDNSNNEKTSMFGADPNLKATGDTSGIGLIGVSLRGKIMGVGYKAEYDLCENYIDGKRTEKMYPTYLGKTEYKKDKITFVGGYHYVDPNYTTTFRVSTSSVKMNMDSYNLVFYEYQLVEDNDDNDQWVDYVDQLWSNQVGNSYFGIPDGVFPGLDKNKNGVSDYNENRNAYPDYEEDFLRYYVDPPQFEVGDDLNNNGIVDIFENDNLPDYEFKTGTEGYGAVLGYNFAKNFNVTLGYLDDALITNRTKKTHMTYSTLVYNDKIPGLLNLNLEYRIKRVEDTMQDETLQYSVIYKSGVPVVTYTPLVDTLTMRDSLVNTIALSAKLTRFKNIEVETKIKHETNQQEIERGGNKQTIFSGIINRIKYNVQVGDKLSLSPMMKTQYELRSGDENLSSLQNIYIFRVDYKFTKKTTVNLGVQYFPKRDYANDNLGYPNNYNKTSYLIQLVNRSQYMRYNVSLAIGYNKQIYQWTVGKQDTADQIYVQLYLGS